MLSTTHSTGRWPRATAWSLRLAIAAAVATSVLCVVVPTLAAREVRRTLDDAGFPEAHFAIAQVGLDRVRLRDVSLGAGLALGDVELDAGVSMLWSGHGPRSITVRGAHVTADALERVARRGGDGAGGPPRIARLRVEHGVIDTHYGAISIDATIDLPGPRPLAIEGELRTPVLHVGAITARDVVVTARTIAGATRVCATATVEDAAVDGCTTLPRETPLADLRALDVDGGAHAADGAWTARGTAHVTWDGAGAFAIGGASIHADLRALADDALRTGAIGVDADASGTLAPLALEVRGRAATSRVVVHDGPVTATLPAVAAPFALQLTDDGGALAISSTAPVVAAAADGTLAIGDETVAFVEPRIVVRDGAGPLRPPRLRWTADAAAIGDVRLVAPSGVVELGGDGAHALRWNELDGLVPVAIGAGDASFTVEDGGLRIASAHASALGGALSIAPALVALDRVTGVIVDVRGLRLADALALLGRERVAGTGLLDGAVAVGLDHGSPSLAGFALHARAGGTLRIVDPAWRERALAPIPDFAIHRRIAGALADFEYTRLSAVLGTPTDEPELRITLEGRGRKVDQELDLSIAVRNVRSTLGGLP